MTHNQEEILKKIIPLKKELEEIDNKVGKQFNSLVHQQTIDFSTIICSSDSIENIQKRREELKSKIMDLLQDLNKELDINWDGSPVHDLFEGLNNIEIKKIEI